jgi:hypothetical protein
MEAINTHSKAQAMTKSIAMILGLLMLSANWIHAETKFDSSAFSTPERRPPTIFIPGIMGSKLVKDGETIWGAYPYDPYKLIYDLQERKPSAYILDSITVANWPLDERAYGKYVKGMYSDLAAEDWFRNFAYDWRQSNQKSAKDLVFVT